MLRYAAVFIHSLDFLHHSLNKRSCSLNVGHVVFLGNQSSCGLATLGESRLWCQSSPATAPAGPTTWSNSLPTKEQACSAKRFNQETPPKSTCLDSSQTPCIACTSDPCRTERNWRGGPITSSSGPWQVSDVLLIFYIIILLISSLFTHKSQNLFLSWSILQSPLKHESPFSLQFIFSSPRSYRRRTISLRRKMRPWNAEPMGGPSPQFSGRDLCRRCRMDEASSKMANST